ncbi:MAG: UbiD family decarboxylase [Anaerolineales bacterium]|nr:UbiD family decarboxylase [Anaerolineales bacterium]
MSIRKYIEVLRDSGELTAIRAPISTQFEIAGVLNQMEPQPVLFEAVEESPFRVAGNLFCSKSAFAAYFKIPVSDIIPMLSQAIDNHTLPEVVPAGPCQEVVLFEPDLTKLPILRHCHGDGGNYISSGVLIARHPVYGQNMDFHRGMQISKDELALRVVAGRHFDKFLQDLGEVDVAICIGNTPNILAAGATSVELGVDELEIANALQPVRVVRAKTVDLYVPADAEFVLEGTVYRDRKHREGPFVDLTGTYDVIRNEPIMKVKAITHRAEPIWQALLPGGLEHKLLMGMPREPTIYKQVNEVVECLDVHVNPGGSSWLHTIVQIRVEHPEDGKRAIAAAFTGHSSCKHVFVVDDDIDIYDPLDVEWAMATRFQGDRDMVVYDKERGSSLDPSAEYGTHLTTKIGFDLTKPIKGSADNHNKIKFPSVDLDNYLNS